MSHQMALKRKEYEEELEQEKAAIDVSLAMSTVFILTLSPSWLYSKHIRMPKSSTLRCCGGLAWILLPTSFLSICIPTK